MPAKKSNDDGAICPECWPDGWPETAVTGGCEHGTWQRATPTPPEKTTTDEAEK